MDFCLADSGPIDSYPTPSTTAPSVSSDMVSASDPTDPTAGLQAAPVRTFTSIRKLGADLRSLDLAHNTTNSYLIVRSVTSTRFQQIERARTRGSLPRNLRLTYYENWNTLIIKVPSGKHEAAHSEFSLDLGIKVHAMGLRLEFSTMSSTLYRSHGISKEPDAAFKPRSFRPRGVDWPTLVIETGWSESLSRLRIDARLWLEKSEGQVKIVLLISVQPNQKMILEKWELQPVLSNRPATRSQRTTTPTNTHTITIDENLAVTGAPLTLEFEKLFLRQPAPPPSQENDITFNAQELAQFAALVWTATMP